MQLLHAVMTHANRLKSAKRLVLCSSVSLAIFSKAATAAPQGRIPWKDEDSVTEQGFLLLLVTCNYHQWSHIALTSSLLLHWRLQVCPPLCLLFHLTQFIQELHNSPYHWYIILEMHKQKNSLRCNAEGAHDVTGNGLCVHLLQEQFPPLGWGNDWDQHISNLINNFHKMQCFGVSAIIWSESKMSQIIINSCVNPAGSYSAVACTLPVTNTSWLLFSCSVLMITLLCVRW